MTLSLTVGTARYIMITLDVARASNKSDISPVMIAPACTVNKEANPVITSYNCMSIILKIAKEQL